MRSALLLALLASGCASAGAPARESRAAPARAADDAALEAAKGEFPNLEDHWVAVAGGAFLGGTLLREDAAALLAGAPGSSDHGYLFRLGTQGDRTITMPALYGPRVAGNGLLAALGLKAAFDPAKGVLTLGAGEHRRDFASADGSAVAWFTVEPASGLGAPVEVEFVVSTGFAGTALVSAADADAAGLVLSEIPGLASLMELVTGRVVPCRRALCRVTLEGFDHEPEARASAVVEVLFPR